MAAPSWPRCRCGRAASSCPSAAVELFLAELEDAALSVVGVRGAGAERRRWRVLADRADSPRRAGPATRWPRRLAPLAERAGHRAHRPHGRAARRRPTGWRASPQSFTPQSDRPLLGARQPRARGAARGRGADPARRRTGLRLRRARIDAGLPAGARSSWRGAAASAACSTSAAARASWRSPPRSAGRRACSRSTTIRARSRWRATTPASNGVAHRVRARCERGLPQPRRCAAPALTT